ncbi:hypothetical protein Tco_0294040 [Tanacetum coccineum]
MKSEILRYGFRHLMENGCIPEENEDEVDTSMEFLTDNAKEDKVKELVYESKLGSYITKKIYMDDLEDLMKDEEVIKEALDKLKGPTGNRKGTPLD